MPDTHAPDEGAHFNAAHEILRHHKPDDETVDKIVTMRGAHTALLTQILATIPASPYRTVAIRRVHESLMMCNASLVVSLDSLLAATHLEPLED